MTMLADEDLIRSQIFFSSLSLEDIDWLIERAEPLEVQKGETIISEGDRGDSMYIIRNGEFQVTKRAGNSDVVVAMCKTGEYFGEMSLLEEGPRTASVRALTDGQLLKVSKKFFDQLVTTRPALTLSILRRMLPRWRNTESMLRQSQKLASLGTLAAGLAHELNNPAAAARRASAQLGDLLHDWSSVTLQLGRLDLNDQQIAQIDALREETRRRAASPVQLDPLTRSDREYRLQDWLEKHGVQQAWELAPELTRYGWQVEDVAGFSQAFTPEQFKHVVRWVCMGSTLFTLLAEVSMGAERISEIVKAVKSYSYLDQAPVQYVDVREGLDNTLVILHSKLHDVSVVTHYAPDLPRIEAYGGELNQVWTNIIANAVEAMQGKGEIKITTSRQDDDSIVVEICDNGPGIPPEAQARIFDPFFTTKPPGSGTGLGLNITHNIIRNHRGHIEVTSKPGETVFRITLPISQKG